jgi:O-antigen ligase
LSLADATLAPARPHAPAAFSAAAGEPVPWYEQAIVIAGFLLLCGTFKVVLPGPAEDRTAGNALYQLVSLAIYMSAFGLYLVRGIPVWFFRLLARAWPLVAITLLMIVSTLWSQAPPATFRRSVALVLGTIFAAYLAGRYDFKAAFRLIAIGFVVFVVFGFLAAGIPSVGITQGGDYTGAWRGMTGNKNDFGRTIAQATALLAVGGAIGLVPWRRIALAAAAAAFVLLILSNSATSFVAAFAAVGLGTFVFVLLGGRIAGYGLRPELRWVVGILAVIGGIVFVTEIWPLFLEAIGRDPTLTGRTKLWRWALALDTRPWLGSGYRAFWIDANTKYFFESFAWNKDADGNLSDSFAGPTHAHSGYVDLWLQNGAVGCALYAILLIVGFAYAARAIRRGEWQVGLFFCVIFVLLHVLAISGTSILQQSEELWFLFTFAYFSVIRVSITTLLQNGAR